MIVVPCNSCGMPLPEWDLAAGEASTCPDCGTRHQVKIFPAALRVASSTNPESAAEGDAACFDHPASRAVASCAVRPLCLPVVRRGIDGQPLLPVLHGHRSVQSSRPRCSILARSL